MTDQTMMEQRASTDRWLPVLMRVELGKQVDTAASRWLLWIFGCIAVVLSVLSLAVNSEANVPTSLQDLFSYSQFPLSLLLVLMGIRTFSSEFASASPLVLVALVPRRQRIVVSKLLAVVVMAAGIVLASLIVNVLVLLGSRLLAAPATWSLDWPMILQTFCIQILIALSGCAMGLLFLNVALGAVVYLGALVVGIATYGMPWSGLITWIDFPISSGVMLAYSGTGPAWVALAVSVTIWTVLPLLAGARRFSMMEIK